jgi:hypothetical protein
MATLEAAEKHAFWCVVEECLTRFHGWTPDRARKRLTELRAAIDAQPDEMAREIVYHDEPFYVAADLAGSRMEIDEVASEYDTLLDRRGW